MLLDIEIIKFEYIIVKFKFMLLLNIFDIMCFEGGVVEVSCFGIVKGKMIMESLFVVVWL